MTDKDDSPKPGHFLPGGAGESAPEPDRRKRAQPSLGQPRDVTSPYGRPQPGAPNRPPQQPTTEQPASKGWRARQSAGKDKQPEQAKQSAGTDQPAKQVKQGEVGRRPLVQTGGAGLHPQQLPPQRPGRRLPLIAAMVAGALLVVGGIVFASTKLIGSFDTIAQQPMSGRTPDPSDPAPLSQPSPTVTVTGPAPPTDTQVVRQHKLYAGRLAATCPESNAQPVSQTEVARYANSVLACLGKAWSPQVTRTGHEFRAPNLVLFADGETTCDGEPSDLGVYCYDEETINLRWDHYDDEYEDSPQATRISLLADVTLLYSFHVMNLVGLGDAESGLHAAAANDAASNEVARRYYLQGECLQSAFVGAIRGSYPLKGRMLDRWNGYMAHVRSNDAKTEGGRRSTTLWMRRGFAGGLKACNTWVAPAKEVS